MGFSFQCSALTLKLLFIITKTVCMTQLFCFRNKLRSFAQIEGKKLAPSCFRELLGKFFCLSLGSFYSNVRILSLPNSIHSKHLLLLCLTVYVHHTCYSDRIERSLFFFAFKVSKQKDIFFIGQIKNSIRTQISKSVFRIRIP